MGLHQGHDRCEQDVIQYLQSLGFLLGEATYHEVMEKVAKDRLASIYSPTSLYIRGRADRIAVHQTKPIVFEWEAKTHNPGPYHDMLIELLPILHHLKRAELGVRCLYVYNDYEKGYDVGFWTNGMPTVRQVYLTPRFTPELKGVVDNAIAEYFPHTTVRQTTGTKGSNDPFLIVDESTVRSLPNWKTLVEEELNGQPATTNSLF
jgi:hypothetical protein